MLSDQYDKSADVSRLQLIASTEQKEFVSHLTDVPCLVQPIDASITGDVEMSFGKNYLMMTDETDIEEGDRVIIDAEEYRVMGIEKHDFMGQQHCEVTLRIFRS